MKKQAGFTLIELAIVLVIIGLLLGGVLRGQELINSAKVKNMAADFRNVPVFIYGYQDKFKSLPGDDKAASGHVGAAIAVNGDGDGKIEGAWNSENASDESVKFWQQVRLAGLAPGSQDYATVGAGSAYFPTNSDGGRLGVTGDVPITNLPGLYFMCSGGILGKFAKQLDTTIDDGTPNNGSLRASLSSSAGTNAAAETTWADSTSYNLCMGF